MLPNVLFGTSFLVAAAVGLNKAVGRKFPSYWI